jgi:hypothetical protein
LALIAMRMIMGQLMWCEARYTAPAALKPWWSSHGSISVVGVSGLLRICVSQLKLGIKYFEVWTKLVEAGCRDGTR